MLYASSFNFHFVEIFNPYPDWVTFHLVFSFGQHLLFSEKCPPMTLDKILLFKMPFSKRAIKLRAFLSSGIGWDFERANVKCHFARSKVPFYISWEIALFQNALLKKGILNKGILSREIGGHFWKDKRAFPQNRQKPLCFSSI